MSFDFTLGELLLAALVGAAAFVLGTRTRRRHPRITADAAPHLVGAARILASLEARIVAAHLAPICPAAKELLLRLHCSVLDDAGLDTDDLAPITTTLHDLTAPTRTP
ncbi:hypothetical protein [Glycomyces sp. MUSA5-2]|uniref:hypothetical protein n=1 Tax=Glycomyces sp. MUSA5-2 TaxID=2053002 RepID=UPI00300B6124